jgi:putative peptide zinc metalloprotease protein
VKKGTVIARIASTDLKSEINVLTAKIAEQAAVIKDLQARPKKEEVSVAERALDVAKKREQFSRERVPRMERLYKDPARSPSRSTTRPVATTRSMVDEVLQARRRPGPGQDRRHPGQDRREEGQARLPGRRSARR